MYQPPRFPSNKHEDQSGLRRWAKILIPAAAVIIAAFITRQVIVVVQGSGMTTPSGGPTATSPTGVGSNPPPVTDTPITGDYLMNLTPSGTVPHRGLATMIDSGSGGNDNYANSVWYTPDQALSDPGGTGNQIHTTYSLDGKYKVFDTWLGQQQSSVAGYPDTFEVWLDGVRAASTQVGVSNQPYHLVVPVKNARQMLIIITWANTFYDIPTLGNAVLFS
jgi:hypothetical protein